MDQRALAVVTGASSGIGRELAKLCAQNGFDLIVAADEPAIDEAAAEIMAIGVRAQAVQTDLATREGVRKLYEAVQKDGRPVAILCANAGRGLGHAFLDQDFSDILRVINTNVSGTLELVHLIGKDMRAGQRGRILFTGSIAGMMPGTFQAVYNGSKAFIDNFALALRNELKDMGVSVTVLMPGPTDTHFFERADMMDTKVGADKKDDPADVATTGFDAMMNGEASVVHGMKNKIQAAVAQALPKTAVAEQHRKLAQPGSAFDEDAQP